MRLPRLDAVLVQAVIAGSLSFAHLHDIASAAGQQGWKAWAYPISVDLLLVASWHRMRIQRSAGEPARAAWTWFAVALATSLGANVATAGLLDLGQVPPWLRILVAGWPAVAFFGGTLLAHTPNHTPAPSVPEPAPESVYLDPLPTEPVPPALELPARAPLMEVPAALLAHARKLTDAHTARTGTPPAPDALPALLGVPAPLAAAIAAQL
jgi:hypothetical protein